jgi:hypothetical protein
MNWYETTAVRLRIDGQCFMKWDLIGVEQIASNDPNWLGSMPHAGSNLNHSSRSEGHAPIFSPWTRAGWRSGAPTAEDVGEPPPIRRQHGPMHRCTGANQNWRCGGPKEGIGTRNDEAVRSDHGKSWPAADFVLRWAINNPRAHDSFFCSRRYAMHRGKQRLGGDPHLDWRGQRLCPRSEAMRGGAPLMSARNSEHRWPIPRD